MSNGSSSGHLRRRIVRLGALALAWLLAGQGGQGAAWAQAPASLPGQLPCSITQKQSLDAADKQAITSHAEGALADLASSEPGASARGRATLLAPLECANLTVTFRLEYAQVIEPGLSRLVGGSDARLAVSALRVLGRLKVTGVLPGLRRGLESKVPAVRFGAAGGYRELLAQLAADPFGFSERNIDDALDALSKALASETDPLVADGLLIALDATRASPALRGKAMARLASGLGERLAGLRAGEMTDEAAWAEAMLRAVDAARLTLFDQVPTGQVDREFARHAALMSGHMLALARDRLASGEGDPTALELLGRVVTAAEGLLVLGHSALTGQTVAERQLGRSFEESARAGDASPFSQAIDPWTGPSGLLVKEPYKAQASDFAPRG